MTALQKTAPAAAPVIERLRGGASEPAVLGAEIEQSPAAKEQIVALLLDICADAQRRQRLAGLSTSAFLLVTEVAVTAATLLLFAVFLAVLRLIWHPQDINGWLIGCGSLFAQTFLRVFRFIPLRRPSPTQTNAAVTLGGVAAHDPRTFAVLLDALPGYSPLAVNEAGGVVLPAERLLQSLTPLLWRVGTNDLLTLTARRRDRIRGALRVVWGQYGDLSPSHADFCAAAVKALVTAGDTHSARLLNRITHARPHSLPPNRAFVRDTAAHCRRSLSAAAAERVGMVRSLRVLLRSPRGLSLRAVPTDLLEPFLGNLDPAVAKTMLAQYIEEHRFRQRAGILSIVGALMLLVSTALLPVLSSETWLLMAGCVILFGFGGSRVAELGATMQGWRRHGLDYRPPNPVKVACDYLARYGGDPRIVPMLLDAAAEGDSRYAPGVAPRLRELAPGDGIYLAARHLRFLRRIISDRVRYGFRDPLNDALISGAIHALGIAGDARARPLLERLAASDDGGAFGGAARAAPERIDAARE